MQLFQFFKFCIEMDLIVNRKMDFVFMKGFMWFKVKRFFYESGCS